MSNNVQHIRRSQYVLTYGPGAIIESKNGPRLIPTIDHGLDKYFLSPEKFEEFEITDSRLGIAVKNITGCETRIFSLPSNASLKKSESRGIYHTYIFPTWKICYGRTGDHKPVLFNSPECPLCKRKDDSSAVRFVRACIHGHLDDVHWNYAVHYGKSKEKCNPKYFWWRSDGSSLSDIVIECPLCGCKTNMGNIYKLDFPCSGRIPEKETPSYTGAGSPYYTFPKRPYNKNCSGTMKVLQRQSTSLRIPETLTLLTIPEYDNTVSNILQRKVVFTALDVLFQSIPDIIKGKVNSEDSFDKIKGILKKHVSSRAMDVIEEHIKAHGIKEFCRLFYALHDEEKTFMDFIYEEFDSLSSGPRSTPNFTMSPPYIVAADSSGICPEIEIYPVNKIRTVTAQMRYTRMPYTRDESSPISSSVYIEDNYWYPGFEGLGEGIFIKFSKNGPIGIHESNAYKEWENKTDVNLLTSDSLWTEAVNKPIFVWLHTLSHAIISSLSLYAGYSSASLRERIYIDRQGEKGGILIYTTSPGEDGSMGGLVGTVNNFSEILEMAVNRIRFCSNDPLCSDVRKTRDRINGATCHSCLLISETSCEHRNMWLDRHIILGD